MQGKPDMRYLVSLCASCLLLVLLSSCGRWVRTDLPPCHRSDIQTHDGHIAITPQCFDRILL